MMKIEEVSRIMNNINEGLNKLVSNSLAYIAINQRHQDAYDYCRKYNVGAWGDNIWHAILDDAIRLRKENEKN